MGARVLAERSSPLGQLTVVESNAVPFRHAPGLSLSAPQPPPDQFAIFTDGEGFSALNRYDGSRETLVYVDYLTSALPYHLTNKPRSWSWERGPARTCCRRCMTAQQRSTRWS